MEHQFKQEIDPNNILTTGCASQKDPDSALAFEEKKRQLFLDLGVSPEDLSSFFNDTKRFPKETWDLLQEKRVALEKQIEATIQEANSFSTKKDDLKPKNHWVFVR